MSHKRKIIGGASSVLGTAIIITLFAQPALAPITETKILGATTEEAMALENTSTFHITSEAVPDGIKATSYMAVDLQSDVVVLEKRPDSALPVASLTKLMTIWTALKYGNKQDLYVITPEDIETTSPNLSLAPGDTVLVDDLITSMLVGSANDAAVALAHYTETKQGGTAFSDLMNTEAERLGMSSSRFSNPTGFDSVANYSSSHDIVLLVTALRNSGIFQGVGRLTSYSFKDQLQKTHSVQATNKLTPSYSDLYAIKTGFTVQALGSMVTTLRTPQSEYLLIVIGSPDREADTLALREKLLHR